MLRLGLGRQKVGALQGLARFLVSWPHSPSRSCHLLAVPWLRNKPSLMPSPWNKAGVVPWACLLPAQGRA